MEIGRKVLWRVVKQTVFVTLSSIAIPCRWVVLLLNPMAHKGIFKLTPTRVCIDHLETFGTWRPGQSMTVVDSSLSTA